MKNKYSWLDAVSVTGHSRLVWIVSLTFIVNFLLLSTAQGIPAFARKYETKCVTCHNSWPALNAKGRKFKEMGYRMSRDEEQGFLNWDKTLPVTS